MIYSLTYLLKGKNSYKDRKYKYIKVNIQVFYTKLTLLVITEIQIWKVWQNIVT